jgi:hypothetical protein
MNQAKASISFQQKMLNPFFFKLFLFLKLPMAFLTDYSVSLMLKLIYNIINNNS